MRHFRFAGHRLLLRFAGLLSAASFGLWLQPRRPPRGSAGGAAEAEAERMHWDDGASRSWIGWWFRVWVRSDGTPSTGKVEDFQMLTDPGERPRFTGVDHTKTLAQ